MTNIPFTDLNLREPHISVSPVVVDEDLTIQVRNYLPIDEKVELLNFIINGALDETTGCFSPLRTEVYYSIGVCHWYAGIDFGEDELTNIGQTYDILETNNILTKVFAQISGTEKQFLQELVSDTIDDIARYNSSAAGIINSMNTDAGSLSNQLTEILGKVENKEGLELLSAIKDVVGKD